MQLFPFSFPILSNYSTSLFPGIKSCFDLAVTSIFATFFLSLKTDTVPQISWPYFPLVFCIAAVFRRFHACRAAFSPFCFLVSEHPEILLLPAFSFYVPCPERPIQFRKIAIRSSFRLFLTFASDLLAGFFLSGLSGLQLTFQIQFLL